MIGSSAASIGKWLIGMIVYTIIIILATLHFSGEVEFYKLVNGEKQTDTLFVDVPFEPVNISGPAKTEYVRDTIVRTDTVSLEDREMKKQLHQLQRKYDSLSSSFLFSGIERVSVFDTVFKKTYDTLSVKHYVFRDQFDISMRFADRTVVTKYETVYIPLTSSLKNKKSDWWQKPLWGSAGFGIGILTGFLLTK